MQSARQARARATGYLERARDLIVERRAPLSDPSATPLIGALALERLVVERLHLVDGAHVVVRVAAVLVKRHALVDAREERAVVLAATRDEQRRVPGRVVNKRRGDDHDAREHDGSHGAQIIVFCLPRCPSALT